MSKTINIGENQIARVYLSGFVKIKNDLDQITYIYPYEFNRLAMEAPIVKRMVEYIKCDYVGYAVDYPRACMRDNLLTDIKALEKPE